MLYVVPLILPEPFSLQLPPDGLPATVTVEPSHIVVVGVVLLAVPGSELTVKLLAAELPLHWPLEAIVYVIVTVSSDPILPVT